MFTTDRVTPNTALVVYEDDNIRLVVGEIYSVGSKSEFHHRGIASSLKEPARSQLTVYGRERAAMQAITDRITK